DKLVELAAVLAHCPAFRGRHAQALALKTEDPLALADLELVAQAGRFSVVGNPYPRQLTVGTDADQQIDTPAVAVHGHCRQYDGDHLALLPGTPGGRRLRQTQQAAIGNAEAILQQVVVVLIIGQDLVQRAHLHTLLLHGDALAGGLLDKGDHTHGTDGEHAEDQAVTQHRAAGSQSLFHISVSRSGPCPYHGWPGHDRRSVVRCSNRWSVRTG